LSEHLLEDEGIRLPVSTLTEWMRAAGLWSRRRKRSRHRSRRERRAHFGELVQLDGSFHDWLEGRGEKGCMMTMTDDATSKVGMLLGKEETFWAATRVLRAWIKEYGVPRALYGTSQDRLIKKLRLKGISTHEGVNEYLCSSYLPAHNARFARRPRSSSDFHLPMPESLNNSDLWCWEETRSVSYDGVIAYKNRRLSLTLRRDMPPRARVLMRESEEGNLRVIYKTPGQAEYKLTWKDYIEPKAIYREKAKATAKPRCRPRADHPWRRTNMIFSIKP